MRNKEQRIAKLAARLAPDADNDDAEEEWFIAFFQRGIAERGEAWFRDLEREHARLSREWKARGPDYRLILAGVQGEPEYDVWIDQI